MHGLGTNSSGYILPDPSDSTSKPQTPGLNYQEFHELKCRALKPQAQGHSENRVPVLCS